MDLTEKEKIIQDEFEKLMPGIEIHPVRAGTDKEVNDCHYSISPEYKNLHRSSYFYKKELTFVHFTNIFALQGILNNRSIRLYNLSNLNDPREYSFAGDLITFNNERREDAKQNMYIISMCKRDILSGPAQYEFNMWRLYGAGGSGVCLELDFSRYPLIDWRDYFLSEVYYGAPARKALNDVSRLLSKYHNQKPRTEIDLGQIVAFHKSNLYRLEKEVRLLFDRREKKVFSARSYYNNDNTVLSPRIETDITKSIMLNKSISYLELPIYHSKFQSISPQIPVPQIKQITLGYSYKDKFDDVSSKIKEIAEKNLGYAIDIKLSRLAKYYYEK